MLSIVRYLEVSALIGGKVLAPHYAETQSFVVALFLFVWLCAVADVLGCSLQRREVHFADAAVQRDLFSRFFRDHAQMRLR